MGDVGSMGVKCVIVCCNQHITTYSSMQADWVASQIGSALPSWLASTVWGSRWILPCKLHSPSILQWRIHHQTMRNEYLELLVLERRFRINFILLSEVPIQNITSTCANNWTLPFTSNHHSIITSITQRRLHGASHKSSTCHWRDWLHLQAIVIIPPSLSLIASSNLNVAHMLSSSCAFNSSSCSWRTRWSFWQVLLEAA